MKKLLLLLLIVFSFSIRLSAQALVIDSTRFISGNAGSVQINYAIPTTDKGILFTGFDYGNPGGIIPFFPTDTVLSNVLIGKIDSNRQISWIKVYGGSDDDNAVSACQTPDGGYAVLAETFSVNGNVTGNHGGNDLWLIRIDGAGNLLWEKCYGSAESDLPISVANTPDGGFIILGSTDGSDDDVPFHYGDFFTMDWLVIKTDAMGSVQWSKDLGGSDGEGQSGSILSIDNYYYLISSSSSTDYDCTDSVWHSGVNTGDDYYVLKLDDTGKVIWDSSYGGTGADVVYNAIYDDRDSTIVMTGYTTSNDYMVTGYHGGGDMWIVKVNKNGTLIWEKALGTPNEELGTSICAASGNGYMAYGGATGYIGGGDNWIVNIDNNGNEITEKVFGGTGHDNAYSIVPGLSGYAATGYSESTVFTEGITNGRNCIGQQAFISYIDYWPLGITNVTKNTKQLFVYPNPACDNAQVVVPENQQGGLTVLNTMGQVVYKEEKNSPITNSEINISEWADGIYLVKWQGEDGVVLTTKLIKN